MEHIHLNLIPVIVAFIMAGMFLASTLVGALVYHRLITHESTSSTFFLQLATLLLVVTPVLILYKLVVYPRFVSPLRHLPKPDQGPLRQRLLKRQLSAEELDAWIKHVPNDGLIRYHGVLNKEEILITSKDAVQECLRSKASDYNRTPLNRGVLASLTGPTSLFVSTGDIHKVGRKKTAPFFQPKHMKELYPMFGEVGRILSDALVGANANAGDEKTPGGGSAVEVASMFQKATLDAIGHAGYGQSFRAIEDPSNEFVKTYIRAFSPELWPRRAALLAFFDRQTVDKLLSFSKNNQGLLKGMQYVKDHGRELIRQRQQDVEKDSEKSPLGNDMLDISLKAGVFSNDELVDIFTTFLLGGHETSASSLTWTIFHLSQDKDLQRRLRSEIRENVRPPSSAPITAETLDNLPLLNGVLKESLRLYPIIRTLRREVSAKKGTTLLGQYVPFGTLISIPIWSINRDQSRWGSDAQEFKPERWIEDPAHGGAGDAWDEMTFSQGTRHCIGEGFARSELLVLLAVLVGRLEFEFVGTGRTQSSLETDPKKHGVRTTVVSRIAGGLWVNVREVDGW